MTTQLFSNTVLKNPLPNTPRLPDLESGKIFSLDADSLGLDDGAIVDNWIASGTANINMRTFNSTTSSPGDGSVMNFPVYSKNYGPNGRSTVVFDGGARLANVGVSLETPQPLTVSLVFQYDPTWIKVSSRIIGGIITNKFNTIQMSSQGVLTLNGGNTVATSFKSADWIRLTVVYDGKNSKWLINDGNIASGDLGINPQRGFTIGAFNGLLDATALPGAKMKLTRWDIYNRALTSDDMKQLHYLLGKEYIA